jgi:multicomponent Na+:H+ antiporter subunit D
LSRMGGLRGPRPLLTVGFTVGTLAIAGVPPLNGFASLGLIHAGVRHEPVVYALALVAQVVTVAALARAAYLGFYRRRPERYAHLEPTRAGMRFSLLTLAASCVAFGVLPGPVVHRVAAPAAGLLLHPGAYALAALGAPVQIDPVHLALPYANPADWAITAVEVALGLALAAWVVRRTEPKPLTWLRRVHTGSVNDYATFSAAGFVLAAAVLLA